MIRLKLVRLNLTSYLVEPRFTNSILWGSVFLLINLDKGSEFFAKD